MEITKTLSDAFPRCSFSPESREIADIGTVVGNLRVAKAERAVEADVSFPYVVPYRRIYTIEREIMKAYMLNYVRVYPKYDPELFSDESFKEILAEAQKTDAVSRSFLPKCTFDRVDSKITIHLNVGEGAVDFVKCAQMEKKLSSAILREFGIKCEIDFTHSETADIEFDDAISRQIKAFSSRTFSDADAPPSQNQIQAAKNNTNTKAVPEETTAIAAPKNIRTSLLGVVKNAHFDESGVLHSGFMMFDVSEPVPIYGRPFEIKPLTIAALTRAANNITLAGEVFGFNLKEMKKKGNFSVSFGLTDKNGSVTVKKLVSEERGEGAFLNIKDGMIIAVEGKYAFDEFENENVFTPSSVMEIKKLDRRDNAPVKRVELHLHTNMSSMDATIPPDVAVKTAAKFGHPAIGITDHGNVQGFQKAMLAVEKLAKDGKNIKVLYGVEAYFVDDTAKAIFGSDLTSFEDEFVVFDIETTGLSPLSCKITEIGAVLVKKGEVLDRFQTFVDPETTIPAEIVKLTGITDDMVKGAPKDNEAVADFIKFIGNRTLIAHNASFDMSFIRKVAEDNRIPFANSYLDTVSMSRFANPELKKHKLNIIAEYFNIGEFNHHRASDDAEMCGKIFYRMVEKLAGEGIYTPAQMSLAMNKSTDPLTLKPHHIILYAQNAVGLKNLYKIISKGYLEYYKKVPRVPKTVLEAHREGVIIGSACEAGQLFTAVLENKPWDELLSIAEFYDYLEIQPLCNNSFLIDNGTVEGEETLKKLNQTIIKLGDTLGKPVVATCDAHFLNYEDEIYRKVLLAGQKFSDADRDIHLYFRTTEEMLKEFEYLGEEKAYEVVVTNTNKIADMISGDIRPFPDGTFTPKIEGAEEDLHRMCYERAHSMYGNPLPELVESRLSKELTSIIKNGFAVLYMIAQKLVKFSEDNGYLVGSRGSVGSSFVASMGGISEVNPLPPHYYCPKCHFSEFFTDGTIGSGFDLPDRDCPHCGTKLINEGHDIPFETFLGFYGDKSPDIDLNFSGDVQGRVHKYTEDLFGAENVFRAGTIGTLADKTAYGFVVKYMEDKNIAVNKSEINRVIAGCVGVRRTTGQHPGGIVVVPKEYEIYDFCPVQHPADDPNSDIITTHFTFEYLHDTLLKLDELGHDIPTKYKLIERFSNTSVLDVAMNDPDTYKIFNSTEVLGCDLSPIGVKFGTLGIPEFGTKFVMQMLEDTKPKNFADLLQISGLSHGTDVWLGNASELIRKGTCTISTVIGTRDDIMLALIRYGVEKSHAFKIMEMVRKGKGLTPEFEAEMRATGVPDWYIDSCKKIKYMFPKAHAAAYVMSAIRLGWYKVHMPLSFYAGYWSAAPGGFDGELAMRGKDAILQALNEIKNKGKEATQKDNDTYSAMLMAYEFLARGYKFLPVDIYKSDSKYYLPEDGKIRLPFSSLSGLGDAAAQNIVDSRSGGEYLSIEDLRERTGISKSVIEILQNNGALDGLSQTSQISLF